MAPWEVMISESQERMLATCRPENYPAVREVCERWGIPIALVGRVTADGDIAIVEGGIGPDGEPNPGAKEIARVPAKALTSDAIVHYRLATPPARRRQAPAPGIPLTAQDGLPQRGMDPAAVLVRASRQPEPFEPPLGLRAVRRLRPEQHRRVAGPRRSGAAGQGHQEGARGHNGRQPGRQRHRSASWRAAFRRRGHAQRQHHRGPPARHHQLPQLRQPGAARGVLAAAGGGPGHGRGLPCPGHSRHRRQRLALQRVPGRRDLADSGDRRGRPAGRHIAAGTAAFHDRGRQRPPRWGEHAGRGRLRLRVSGRYRPRRTRPLGSTSTEKLHCNRLSARP